MARRTRSRTPRRARLIASLGRRGGFATLSGAAPCTPRMPPLHVAPCTPPVYAPCTSSGFAPAAPLGPPPCSPGGFASGTPGMPTPGCAPCTPWFRSGFATPGGFAPGTPGMPPPGCAPCTPGFHSGFATPGGFAPGTPGMPPPGCAPCTPGFHSGFATPGGCAPGTPGMLQPGCAPCTPGFHSGFATPPTPSVFAPSTPGMRSGYDTPPGTVPGTPEIHAGLALPRGVVLGRQNPATHVQDLDDHPQSLDGHNEQLQEVQRTSAPPTEMIPCTVKEEDDEENLPDDPYPTAVSYCDENAEADVAMAQRDAPPVTFLGGAMAPPEVGVEAIQGEKLTEPAHEDCADIDRCSCSLASSARGGTSRSIHSASRSIRSASTGAATNSATILSSAGAHCYVSGTFFVLESGAHVRVEAIKVGCMIRNPNPHGHPLRVKEIHRFEERQQDLIHFLAPPAEITITASHRIMVECGGSMQPDMASHLSVGDRVVLGDGTVQALTAMQEFTMPVEVFELKFAPDEPVAAFHSSPSTILTMGSGYKRTRRGGDTRRRQMLMRAGQQMRAEAAVFGSLAEQEGRPGSSDDV